MVKGMGGKARVEERKGKVASDPIYEGKPRVNGRVGKERGKRKEMQRVKEERKGKKGSAY